MCIRDRVLMIGSAIIGSVIGAKIISKMDIMKIRVVMGVALIIVAAITLLSLIHICNDIDESLMSSLLELFSGIFIFVNSSENCNNFLLCWKWYRACLLYTSQLPCPLLI